MNNLIAIGLSPNAGVEDIQVARDALRNTASWLDHTHVQEATRLFQDYLGVANLVLTSSGRNALYSLLKAYGIGAGDEVIVQAFTCIAVPEPILWVGAKPVYADIDADTFSMNVEDFRKKITDKTKAVIVQHTFGIPGRIHEIMAIAREKNILVIEDCAHALGSTINGHMVGTVGDAAIFSFGRDKTISTVYGGAVRVKNDAIFNNILEEQKKLPQPPQPWIQQQLRHPILFDRVKRLYTKAFIGKTYMRALQSLGMVSKAVESKERQGEMPEHINYAYSPALALLLKVQLKNIRAVIARRKAIARMYTQAFAGKKFGVIVDRPGVEAVLMRFPLLVANRAAVLAKAKEQNIILGDWYDAALVPANASFAKFHYKEASCPTAEKVASQVINLPTYHSLTEEDISRVIAVVNMHAEEI